MKERNIVAATNSRVFQSNWLYAAHLPGPVYKFETGVIPGQWWV